jgi:hypothetical protein
VTTFVRVVKSLVAAILSPLRWWLRSILTAHLCNSGSALGPMDDDE